MENNQQTSIDDVLEIVTFIKDNAVAKEEFDGLRSDVSGVRSDVSSLKTDVKGLVQRVDKIEATMVTKNYLDDKLVDVKGDIIAELRHEDKKVVALIEVLRNRNVISSDEAKGILGMKPFPQIFVQ